MSARIRRCVLLLAAIASLPAAAAATASVFQTGPAFVVDAESLFTGYASAELARGGVDGTGSFSYVGSAYADTRHGALGAAAQATGVGYEQASDRLVVHARSMFDDALIFSQTGFVTLRLAVQGNFASVSGGQMSSNAKLKVPGFSESTSNTFWRGGTSRMNISTSNETVISDLPSNFIVWLETTVGVFATIPVPFSAELEVFVAPPVTGDASALFNHTAQLEVLMPSGMTFTSLSGNFLVPDEPPPDVNAPASIGLAAPFAALAAAWLRRRGRAHRAVTRGA